jgi:hypothetical protein
LSGMQFRRIRHSRQRRAGERRIGCFRYKQRNRFSASGDRLCFGSRLNRRRPNARIRNWSG